MAGENAHPLFVSAQQSHYRNYAGFHTKSIRNIWEQHERHDMMDLAPDVLVRLAEDATYKQWELINVSVAFCLVYISLWTTY